MNLLAKEVLKKVGETDLRRQEGKKGKFWKEASSPRGVEIIFCPSKKSQAFLHSYEDLWMISLKQNS
jgi:hypothetical protein